MRFEYSPGRGDMGLAGNRSAFDVFVEYQRVEGRAFLDIEVKYHENMKVSAAADPNGRYPEIARSTHAFRDEASGDLGRPPLQQLSLDHLLVLRLRDEAALDSRHLGPARTPCEHALSGRGKSIPHAR